MTSITALFNEVADNHNDYTTALRLVQQNSRGRIWLIGGFVYRSLASRLYDTSSQPCDYDFMVEQMEPTLRLPQGWEQRKNSRGNPKLISGNIAIDLIPLHNLWYFVQHGIEPTVDKYLERTPLTIQSIAYDTVDKKVFGEIGEKALYEKTVAIHHQEVAAYIATKKGKSISQLVQEKADSLGFTAILP